MSDNYLVPTIEEYDEVDYNRIFKAWFTNNYPDVGNGTQLDLRLVGVDRVSFDCPPDFDSFN